MTRHLARQMHEDGVANLRNRAAIVCASRLLFARLKHKPFDPDLSRASLSPAVALIAVFCVVLGAAWPVQAGVLDQLEKLGKPVNLGAKREFLPPDEAFRLSERVNAAGELEFNWQIEPGYYLYRDKVKTTALTADIGLGELRRPAGEAKDDPEFGRVDIYRDDVTVVVPVTARPANNGLLEVEVGYQGCAEDGICYPPISKTVGFSLLRDASAAGPPSAAGAPTAGLSAADRIALELGQRSLLLTVVTFIGLGLLLSLTPCVLPMVPILSGIIIGQKAPLSAARAFTLSTVYVLAMAATYALAGIAAGLLGQNLQAAFQHPAVIGAFAAVFVVLACSMFGYFELQIPAALQSRLDQFSRKQHGGSLLGVGVMGVLSAIIVGPCVAPPLAGALAYIGQTGSPVIGGAALFALGIGMGLPLIAVGTSAGALLPRAGAWMVRVKQVFGVIFLGVAVWFLERIVPGPAALMLWAVLLIGSAVFLGALNRLAHDARSPARLAQALGLVFLVYGGVLVVGAAAGGRDPLAPLAPLTGGGNAGKASVMSAFRAVKSLDQIESELTAAASNNESVLLDVYADWCIECKHLERETFADPAVRARLQHMRLLRADVTADDDIDRSVLAQYELFGPPAVLFFRGVEEVRQARLIGFADAEDFGALLDFVAAAP